MNANFIDPKEGEEQEPTPDQIAKEEENLGQPVATEDSPEGEE